jgi:hypothetical protein
VDVQPAAESVLASLNSLLMVLCDDVRERLFRAEEGQPGSINRALLRTHGRLTSKLEHRDNEHLKVMMLGPVADSLARRIEEIAEPEKGVLSLVDFRLFGISESLRGSALAARVQVASQLNRAQMLTASRSALQSTHAGLMGRLSGDAMIDQPIRREITDVEDQLADAHREENQIFEALRIEADALRQRIDAVVQMLGGYVQLSFVSRSATVTQQPKTIEQIAAMTPEEVAKWWSRLTDAEQGRYDTKFVHVLRNLDGLPIDYRIEANEKYLESRVKTDSCLKEALEKEGLLDEHGRLTAKVVLYDTSEGESFGESITAHGNCKDYGFVNLHYEGTGAGPGTDGTKLRQHYNDMNFNRFCTTTFVMRNTQNAEWWSREKFPTTDYGVVYNAEKGKRFVEGMLANGDAKVLQVTGHSHGARSAAEIACITKADAVHLQGPAPGAFSHMNNGCVKDIYVYRDTDSSDAGSKIISGDPRLIVEGLLEEFAPYLGPGGFVVKALFDDTKGEKVLSYFSKIEEWDFKRKYPDVSVTSIASGQDGVVGSARDSLTELNKGSSHHAFTFQFWRNKHRSYLATVNKNKQANGN